MSDHTPDLARPVTSEVKDGFLLPFLLGFLACALLSLLYFNFTMLKIAPIEKAFLLTADMKEARQFAKSCLKHGSNSVHYESQPKYSVKVTCK